ncbi:MAG: helix-turn-helix transcriptional regulator, partial [Desulfofustis sp.]|nr:helix-turn-helix transcriptional regulator [Desulfofustis sp.]
MNETSYPGGPEMVKIDGGRVRALRESKGLTQLYIATAVDVTTDTVSRWENKRYPTIKKENALKLAAALEVDLAELLDRDEAPEPDSPETPPEPPEAAPEPAATSLADDEPEQVTTPAATGAAPRLTRTIKTTLIITALLLSGTALAIFFMGQGQDRPLEISVRRIAPPHFVAGQPFPVFLKVDAPADEPRSIILKESIPPGLHVVTALPPISGQDKKDNSIKWLTKVRGTTTFAYTLRSELSYQGTLHLDGFVKGPDNATAEITVDGDRQSISGVHHWADSNRDNRISDEEILAVYDLAGSDQPIGIDMELIEDIWLGDGY